MPTPDEHYTPYNEQMAELWHAPIALVDDAIEWALDLARGQDGWSGIPDMNPLIWGRIYGDVENYIEHEMEAAA